MKTIRSIGLVLLALSTLGICAAEIPNLVGNWAGTETGYDKEVGYIVDTDDILTFSITEQNGRIFNGELTYQLNGTDVVEGFAGIIDVDNKNIYIAEFVSGYDVGTIISEDEIDMMYLDSEAGEVFIETLRRVAD